MTLLWIIGAISLFVWPFCVMIYINVYKSQIAHSLVIYLIILIPPVFILGLAFYLSQLQKDVVSQHCGIVEAYQTYQTAGNKNNRKSFERVKIIFDGQQTSRHLRVMDDVSKQKVGMRVCFKFYDRKLNSHLNDSILIDWVNHP